MIAGCGSSPPSHDDAATASDAASTDGDAPLDAAMPNDATAPNDATTPIDATTPSHAGTYELREDGVVVRSGSFYAAGSYLDSAGMLNVTMYEMPPFPDGLVQGVFSEYGTARPDPGTYTCVTTTMRNWFQVNLFPGIARWSTTLTPHSSCLAARALPYTETGANHRVTEQTFVVEEATASRVRASFTAHIEGNATSPAAGHTLDLTLAFDACISSTIDGRGAYPLEPCP